MNKTPQGGICIVRRKAGRGRVDKESARAQGAPESKRATGTNIETRHGTETNDEVKYGRHAGRRCGMALHFKNSLYLGLRTG